MATPHSSTLSNKITPGVPRGRLIPREWLPPSVEDGKRLESRWRCDCTGPQDSGCKGTVVVRDASLKRSHTRSCGCLSREAAARNGHKNRRDLTGQQFGRLIPREWVPGRGTGPGRTLGKWRCDCTGPKEFGCKGTVTVFPYTLKTECPEISCGCYRAELRQSGKRAALVAPEVGRGAVADYEAGMSAEDAGRKHGIATRTVLQWVQRSGGRTRRNGAHTKHSFKTAPERGDLQDSFFSTIDTEEKAYWLGFFAADGYVSKEQVSLKLAAVDEDHVRAFAAAALPRAGVRRSTYTNRKSGVTTHAVVASALAPRMVDDLRACGVAARKTDFLKPWDGPPELLPHYFRGLVDGDGWLVTGKNAELGLCGPRAVMQALAEFVRDTYGYVMSVRPKGSIWTARVKSRGATVVAHFLYADAKVFLPRKRKTALELAAVQYPQKSWCGLVTLKTIRAATLQGRPRAVSAELLGTSVAALNRLMKAWRLARRKRTRHAAAKRK
jgi:hypothetical protein